jgi:S1-C subfamily serine protease
MTPIGETINLKLLREGKVINAKVKIAKPLDESGTEAETVPQLAGATVANLKSGSPRGKVEGVLVTKADANSPAWLHGLRPGDIIVGVNRRKIRTVQEFLAVLQTSEDVIALNLLRGDFRLTLVIR